MMSYSKLHRSRAISALQHNYNQRNLCLNCFSALHSVDFGWPMVKEPADIITLISTLSDFLAQESILQQLCNHNTVCNDAYVCNRVKVPNTS